MGDKCNIKVAIRVRELIKREIEQGCSVIWAVENGCQISGGGQSFMFDRVFNRQETTEDVYRELVLPIMENAMAGINGTVFAYGQTASGKTYTMTGTAEDPGIIQRCIEHIYTTVENTPERQFLIRVSYLEIYNEEVTDLLTNNPKAKKLEIHENEGKIVVKCEEKFVKSVDAAMDWKKRGEAVRHMGSTNMNEQSSRSHTIFKIIIESCESQTAGETGIFVATLNLVDLAGSERAKQTGSTGVRFAEGTAINKSLSTLGLVINQLSSGGPADQHVSYRDSKLTRLLQNALGGNSITAIICTVTPAVIDETVSTLRFAKRAKTIKNAPTVNEFMTDDAQIHRLQKEVSKLQAELNAVKSGDKLFDAEHLEMKLAEQQEQIRQQYEAKIRDIANIFSVSSLGFNFNDEPRGLSVKRDKRRETWGGGGLLGTTSATFGEFGHKRASRHIPGKSELVRSNLMSLEEGFEPLEDDVSCVSEDRRSFEEYVRRRSKQSIDPDCIFRPAFIEVEVQTEPVHDLAQMAASDDRCIITELESRLADKDDEVEALKSELEQSKSETVELQSQVESLKQTLKSSPSREDISEPQTGLLTAEISCESSCGSVNFGGPCQSVDEQVGAVESGMQALQLEVQQLTAELQASKSLLEKVMYENERLLGESETWKIEADSARAEMEKSASDAENWKCRVNDLQAEVEQLSADCQAWKQQLESREIEIGGGDSGAGNMEIEVGRMELDQLTREVETWKCNMESLRVEKDKLQAEKDGLESDVESIAADRLQVDGLQLKIETLAAECERWKQEIESLQVENQRLEVEKSDLKSPDEMSAVDNVNLEMEILLTDSVKWKLQAESLQEEKEQLVAELESLKVQMACVTHAKEELSDSTESESDVLKTQLAKLLEEVESLKSQTDLLRSENAELIDDKNKLNLEAESLLTEKDGLSSESEGLRMEIEKLREEVQSGVEKIRGVEMEKEQLAAEVEMWKSQEQSTVNDSSTIESLQLEMEKLRTEAQTYQSQVEALHLENEQLASDLDHWKTKAESLLADEEKMDFGVISSRLQTLQSENERLISDVDIWKAQEESAVSEKNRLVIDLEELNSRFQAVKEECYQLSLERTEQRAEMELLASTKEKLAIDFEAVNSHLETLESENERLVSDVVKWKTVAESVTFENKQLVSDLNSWKTQTEAAVVEREKLTVDFEAASSRFETLQAEYERLTAERDELKTQAETLEKDVDHSAVESQFYKCRMESLKLEMSMHCKSDIPEFDRTLNADEMPEGVVAASEDVVRLEKERDELRKQLSEAFELSEGVIAKNQQYKDEIVAVNSQLNKSKKSIEKLKSDYEVLVREYDELREFTRYEKDLRDASILEHQEECQHELCDRIAELESRLKQMTDERNRLKVEQDEFAACSIFDDVNDNVDADRDEKRTMSCKGDLTSVEEGLEDDVEDDNDKVLNGSSGDVSRRQSVGLNRRRSRLSVDPVSSGVKAEVTDAQVQTEQESAQRDMQDKISQLEVQLDQIARERDQLRNEIVNKMPSDSHPCQVEDAVANSSTNADIIADLKCKLAEQTSLTEDAAANSSTNAAGIVADLKRKLAEQTALTKDAAANSSTNADIVADLKCKLAEQTALAIDAQDELIEERDKLYTLQEQLNEQTRTISQLTEECAQKSQLERELRDSEEKLSHETRELEERLRAANTELELLRRQLDSERKKSNTCGTPTGKQYSLTTPSSQLLDLQTKYDDLQKRYERAMTDIREANDRLVAGSNRDQHVQKSVVDLEKSIKESNSRIKELEVENGRMNERLNREIHDLNQKLEKANRDLALSDHRRMEIEREASQLRTELRSLEGQLAVNDNLAAISGIDPQKLQDHIKKLQQQLALTNQRCSNYETRNKELQAEVKKQEDAASDRGMIQVQLRDTEYQLRQKCDELSRIERNHGTLAAEATMLRQRIAELDDQLRKAQAAAGNEQKSAKSQLTELSTLQEKNSQLELRLLDMANTHQRHMCDLQTKMVLEAEVKASATHQEQMEKLLEEHQRCKSDLLRKTSELEAKVNELQAELVSVSSERDSLRSTVSRLDEKLKSSVHDAENLQSLRRVDVETLDGLRKELDALRSSYETQKAELVEKVSNLEACQLELQSHNEASFQARISQLQDENRKISRHYEEREAEVLAACEQTIAAGDAEIRRLKEGHTASVEGILEDHAAELKRVTSEHLEELEELRREHDHKMESLRGSQQEEMARHAAALAAECGRRSTEQIDEMAQFATDVVRLQSQLEAAEDAQKKSEEEYSEKLTNLQEQHKIMVEELRQQLEDLEKQLEVAKEVQKKSENEHLEKLTTIADQYKAQMEELHRRLADQENAESDLEMIMTRKESEIEDLEKQLEQQRHRFETQLENLKRQQEEEMESLRAQQAAEVDELQRRQAVEIQSLQQQMPAVVGTGDELESALKRIAELENTITQGRALVDSLNADLCECTATIQSYEEELETLKADNEEANAECDDWQRKCDELDEQVRTINNSNEQLKLELENQLKISVDQLAERDRRLSDLNTQHGELQARYEKQFEQLTAERQQVDDYRLSVEQLRSKLDQSTLAVSALEADKAAITKQVGALAADSEKLCQEIVNLKRELKNLNEFCDDIEVEKQQLLTAFEDTEAKLELKEKELSRMASGAVIAPCQGHTEMMNQQKAEIEKLTTRLGLLNASINGLKVEKRDLMSAAQQQQSTIDELSAVKARLEEESKTLRKEVDKDESFAKLRRTAADQLLRINDLEIQLQKATDGPNRKIRSLELELQKSEEARRELQNRIRRRENEANTTYMPAPPRASTGSASSRYSISSTGATEPPDPSGAGLVGLMILSNSEIQLDVMKLQIEDLRKRETELKKKLDEMRLRYEDARKAYDREHKENKELRARMTTGRKQQQETGSSSSPSASSQQRPPLSPRQESIAAQPASDYESSSAIGSASQVKPGDCKQQ